MKYCLITIIFLLGCDFDQTLEYSVDPKLTQFVDRFFDYADKNNITIYKDNLIVRFDSECNNCAAKSFKEGGQRIIILKQNTWDWYMRQSKDTSSKIIENILFHELGHALLNRIHNDPAISIMNYSLTPRVYQHSDSLRQVMIKELFHIPA